MLHLAHVPTLTGRYNAGELEDALKSAEVRSLGGGQPFRSAGPKRALCGPLQRVVGQYTLLLACLRTALLSQALSARRLAHRSRLAGEPAQEPSILMPPLSRRCDRRMRPHILRLCISAQSVCNRCRKNDTIRDIAAGQPMLARQAPSTHQTIP